MCVSVFDSGGGSRKHIKMTMILSPWKEYYTVIQYYSDSGNAAETRNSFVSIHGATYIPKPVHQIRTIVMASKLNFLKEQACR